MARNDSDLHFRNVAGSGGSDLVERTLLDMAHEEEQRFSHVADWDTNVVELSTLVHSRIPPNVEEQSARARHRTNCGFLAVAKHAWVSVDNLLNIWDYRKDSPHVLTVPADSAIVSVSAIPPRSGIFDINVHLLLIIVTRLTVTLYGMELSPDASHNVKKSGGYANKVSKLRIVTLDGYSVPVDGAVFHCIRHTLDGHLFLSCGALQVFELAYSRDPGIFQNKCRLIQHAAGWLTRIQGLFTFDSVSTGRARLLECASRDFVFTADDRSTVRLYRIRDASGRSPESVARLEYLDSMTIERLEIEVAKLTTGTASAPHQAHLAARCILHIFPAIGLDGHLRLQVVTDAKERLFFVCSAASRAGPRIDAGTASAPPSAAHPGERFYGFWLQRASESAVPVSLGRSGGEQSRQLCTEEVRDPCIYASGVWLTATNRPGNSSSELDIFARVDAYLGSANTAGASVDQLDLRQTLKFDVPVLEIIEEHEERPNHVGQGLGTEAYLEGEPGAFRGSRSFVLFLQNAVQVVQLTYKVQSLGRRPTTAAECCLHLMQLAVLTNSDKRNEHCRWLWSLHDATIPDIDEQQHYRSVTGTLAPIRLGRWFSGFLRFLAVVLRPAWTSCLVIPGSSGGDQGRSATLPNCKRRALPANRDTMSLCLGLNEGLLQRLLERLRPILQFVREGASLFPSNQHGASVARASIRASLYSRERGAQDEAAAQVKQLLREVIDIADRVQQVLGILCIIHQQRVAYRVLQSSLLQGDVLQALLRQPLGKIVSSSGGLAPIVQLCTALVVESGLATPGALGPVDFADQRRNVTGVAAHVCAALQELSPAIFAQVELRYLQARPGSITSAQSQTSEMLRRYVECVSASSLEDHWTALTRSIQAMTAEDARGAAEICVDKIQQLHQTEPAAAPMRSKQLVEAFLDALFRNPEPLDGSRYLVEYILIQTSSLRFSSDAEGSRPIPFIHGVVLGYLLASSCTTPCSSPCICGAHRVLVAMLESGAADIQAFLRSRYTTSRVAAEHLWKYYSENGQAAQASAVLLHLAEWDSPDCSLQDRIYYLVQAKQAAARALPHSQEVVDKLELQVDVANRVQTLLHHELQIIAGDDRVSEQWRSSAKQRFDDFQKLQSLQTLYHTAVDFGLYHIVLVVADFSPAIQEQSAISAHWVSTFFPPVESPYSELGCNLAFSPHSRFPLLCLRRCASFFVTSDATSSQFLDAGHPEFFQRRTKILLGELETVIRAPSPVWDVRTITTVIEFCNCLWLVSIERSGAKPTTAVKEQVCDKCGGTDSLVEALAMASLGPAAPASMPEQVAEAVRRACAHERSADLRAWVALRLLPGRPFHFTTASVVAFYAEMLSHLPDWSRDLQGIINANLSVTQADGWVSEDDLYVHLAEVVLGFLSSWLEEVEKSAVDSQQAADFRGAWPTSQGVLGALNLRLNSLQCRSVGPTAIRLLPKAQKIETKGRMVYDRFKPSIRGG